MKLLWIGISFLLLIGHSLQAQDSLSQTKQDLHFGYGLHFNYNLYAWHQKPFATYGESSSSGQIFNILPGISGSFWVGNVKNWLLSVEAGIEYLPFELDLQKYKGLGGISFPIMAKVHIPIAKQHSTWIMLHGGLGCQLIKTDLYANPNNYQNFVNPFYTNIAGEVGIHLSAVGYHYQHIRELEYFVRIGGAPDASFMFQTGVKLSFWNRIK